MSQAFEAIDTIGQIRKVGRPRAFEDKDVFRAIHRVLIREGYHDLTLHAVANELDVSTPALARRFGDKRELLGAFFEDFEKGIEASVARMNAHVASPIDRLRARYMLAMRNPPFAPERRPGAVAWLEFLVGIRTDRSYGHLLEPMTRRWVDQVEQLLREAHTAGEVAEAEFPQLAYLLAAAMFGSMVYWFEHRRGDLHEHMGRVFEFFLQPYRGPAYPPIQ